MSQFDDKILYEWKTDIFNNHYGLYKDDLGSAYQNSISTGSLYVRNYKGIINAASAELIDVSLFKDGTLLGDEIINFDIFFDTIMFQTSSSVHFTKLNYDYDDGRIFSIADDRRTIELSADSGGYFAGTWFEEEPKFLTICNTVSAGGYIYPEVRTLDINSNVMTQVYPNSASELTSFESQLSGLSMERMETPVFTKNSLTKLFNVSFLGFADSYADNFTLVSINLKDEE
jgi:hypothetical protein